MKNIIHIWQSHYPWDVRVAKINRAVSCADFEPHVLARKRFGEPAEANDGVSRIHRVGWDRARFVSLPVPGNIFWGHELDLAIQRVKPSLLLVRDIPLALTAARQAHRHRLPVILDMAEHYPEAMRSWKKYTDHFVARALVHNFRLPDRLEAHIVPRMSGILVVCDEQKERLMRDYSYPKDRICVVRNTPDQEFRRGLYSQPGQTIPPTRFGSHGNLCNDRDLDTLLKGFDLAAQKNREITLLMAGGGESETSLRALASQLASKDRITFTGRFTPEQQSGLYSRVDFGIVSVRGNVFSEHGLANKFFDYAALGKPFIYTDVGPMRRLMSRMRCGLSFTAGNAESVADAFFRILQADYSQLRQNGIDAVAREFNWEADTARMISFFDRYIGGDDKTWS